MSQVKISGNASGTGVLTIAAPNTNTDRSITIPDKAGAIAVGAGTIVQVVSSYGSAVDTTSTSATLSLHTQAITPTSSSNKILVICSVWSERVSTNTGHFYSVSTIRGSTDILTAWGNAMNYGLAQSVRSHAASSVLDSPATTSSVTYELRGVMSNGGGSRFIINKPALTLLEVVA